VIFVVSCVAFMQIIRPPPSVDWPSLVQRPYVQKAIDAPPLPPVTKVGEDWAAARRRLKSEWSAILGPSPIHATSLDSKTHNEERLPGFHRSIVSFQSEGGDRVEAALLVPQGLQSHDSRAAVVVFHETTPLGYRQPAGIAGNAERHFGVELVRRGYVVLCPDCFILKRPSGASAKGPIDVARLQAAALKKRRPGWSGMGKLTFDASRCVDFLETLSFVDQSRIGCLGFSLGAKQVLYAMAFESRFRAGVFNEGGVGVPMSNWSDKWYLGSSIKDRLLTNDHHQLLALAAPRAILIQGGGSADGDASWPYIAAALPVYRTLGASDRIGLHHHGGRHAYPPAARQTAYRWLDHWLEFQPKGAGVRPTSS
jgi:dienelactone hydrolase